MYLWTDFTFQAQMKGRIYWYPSSVAAEVATSDPATMSQMSSYCAL
jgi:hypothetical protein